jgi:ribosome biogenesis GTPase
MLEAYGWSDELRQQFEPFAERGLAPARVSVQQRGILTLVAEHGETFATLSGRFVRDAAQGEFPVAGDWVGVVLQPDGSAVIHALVPRRTAFVRRAPADSGQTEQVVAANADLALLVAALTRDLNLRRLERYLALAWTSGAQPVVLLTKADVAEDIETSLAEVESIAFGVPILVLSVVDGRGLEELSALLQPGKTAVLLGSSGAGKSTLVNVLAGTERMATQETRASDERGRHTTTHRELILLPSGAILLDTPGMRELGVVESLDGLTDAFSDIDELALQCKFNDCAHDTEPGCAIRAAIEDGTLDQERYESYLKLEREQAFQERKGDPAALAAERKKWKLAGKEGMEAMRFKGRTD